MNKLIRGLLVAAPVLLLSCQQQQPLSAEQPLPAENRGTALTPSTGVVQPAATLLWSRDGTRLFFLSCPIMGPVMLGVMDAATGSFTTIDTTRGDLFDLTMTSDGQTLFYLHADPSYTDLDLRRVSTAAGSTPATVLDSLCWASLTVANDGTRVVVCRSDSFGPPMMPGMRFSVFSTETHQWSPLPAVNGFPLLFAPDDSYLLWTSDKCESLGSAPILCGISDPLVKVTLADTAVGSVGLGTAGTIVLAGWEGSALVVPRGGRQSANTEHGYGRDQERSRLERRRLAGSVLRVVG